MLVTTRRYRGGVSRWGGIRSNAGGQLSTKSTTKAAWPTQEVAPFELIGTTQDAPPAFSLPPAFPGTGYLCLTPQVVLKAQFWPVRAISAR
jgi:hypothetical protein